VKCRFRDKLTYCYCHSVCNHWNVGFDKFAFLLHSVSCHYFTTDTQFAAVFCDLSWDCCDIFTSLMIFRAWLKSQRNAEKWKCSAEVNECLVYVVYFVVLRSPPSPSFFKSLVYQRDSSQPQKVTITVYSSLCHNYERSQPDSTR